MRHFRIWKKASIYDKLSVVLFIRGRMSSMERPQSSQVRASIGQIRNADNQFYSILELTEGYKNKIKVAYEKLRQQAVYKALETIPIEELNRDKNGIRVSALKNAGYNNIRQLLGIPANRLTAINGIGQENATKIAGKVNELWQSTSHNVKVKINSSDKSKEVTDIVTSLAILMNSKEIYDRAARVYSDCHSKVTYGMKSAKGLSSSIRWFFAGTNKRNEQINSLQYLDALLQNGYAAEAKNLSTRFTTVTRSWNSRNSLKSFEENSAPYFAWLEQITGSDVQENTLINGLPEELVREVEAFPLDTSLMKSVLRNYQEFGTKYILHQKRVLLGDEMGLGKTVQAIAAMAHLTTQGKTHFLVVCPVSVMVNWFREVPQHSKLQPAEIYGDDRNEELEAWYKNGGVGITTYESISKLELPEDLKIDMLIVDEAHYVKNPEANRTKALAKISKLSESILFMTGTPLENKVEEMVFLISLLNKEVSAKIGSMVAMAKAPEFREAIAPVYLRRVRTDVLTELPEKLEKEHWCKMTPAEEAVYKETLEEESYMQIRQVSWNVPDIKDSSKANRLLEICEDAKENSRKVIVFSFFLDTITKVQNLLPDRCYGPINGSVSANRRQEIIDEFKEAKEGSVLVCQIMAGGVGLNIQTASVVVICEPQWKPSTENQAISRVYRMGQSKDVMVHRLLTANSVDEKIMNLLKGKTEIFDSFADESAIDEAAKSINENKAMAAIVKSERERYGIRKEDVERQ